MEVNIYSVPAAVIREGLRNLSLKWINPWCLLWMDILTHCIYEEKKKPLLEWVTPLRLIHGKTITNVFFTTKSGVLFLKSLLNSRQKEFWNKSTIRGLRTRGEKQQEPSSQPTSKTQTFLWSSIMHFYRFLFFFLYSYGVSFVMLFPPALLIPHSDPFIRIRPILQITSESSPFWNESFLCVCVRVQRDRWIWLWIPDDLLNVNDA